MAAVHRIRTRTHSHLKPRGSAFTRCGDADKYAGSGKKIVLTGTGFNEQAKTLKNWKVELL